MCGKPYRQGALGYVPKSSSPEVLLAAVELVMKSDIYLPPLLRSELPAIARTRIKCNVDVKDLLTDRQITVLQLVAQGAPNKVVANTLSISEKTVKTHITSIFRLLNVVNRTQAARVGRDLGLL